MLPKDLRGFFSPLKKEGGVGRDLPGERESLATRCIIGTEPVDDTSFFQIPPAALSCLFPFLVGQRPKGGWDSGKGPGQHTQIKFRPGRIHVPTVQPEQPTFPQVSFMLPQRLISRAKLSGFKKKWGTGKKALREKKRTRSWEEESVETGRQGDSSQELSVEMGIRKKRTTKALTTFLFVGGRFRV